LSRLQKENDQKSSSGGNGIIKHSDLPSKDPGCLSFLNSFNKQQNEGAIDSFGYSDGALKIQMDTTSHEKRRASTSDIPDPKIRKSSEIGLNQSLESAESEANHTVFNLDCISDMSNDQSPDIIFTSNLSSKTPGFNLDCISDMEIYKRNSPKSISTPFDEDLNLFLLQGEYYDMNFDMQNIEMS